MKRGRQGNLSYGDRARNHAVLPDRLPALAQFTSPPHKRKYERNSNSEDALTWSCFDLLAQLPAPARHLALTELWEDAFEDCPLPACWAEHDIEVNVGKRFTCAGLSTEVDASVECPGMLLFVEAKLYSSVDLGGRAERPNDQIAHKLNVGLRVAAERSRHGSSCDFYFAFLDVAPRQKLTKRVAIEEARRSEHGFHGKWRSAYWFNMYKDGVRGNRKLLKTALASLGDVDVSLVARRMGWLTWADLFKVVLRAAIRS